MPSWEIQRKSSRALVPATVTKRSGLTPFRVFGAVQTEKIPTGLKRRDLRYLVMLSERQRVGCCTHLREMGGSANERTSNIEHRTSNVGCYVESMGECSRRNGDLPDALTRPHHSGTPIRDPMACRTWRSAGPLPNKPCLLESLKPIGIRIRASASPVY